MVERRPADGRAGVPSISVSTTTKNSFGFGSVVSRMPSGKQNCAIETATHTDTYIHSCMHGAGSRSNE